MEIRSVKSLNCHYGNVIDIKFMIRSQISALQFPHHSRRYIWQSGLWVQLLSFWTNYRGKRDIKVQMFKTAFILFILSVLSVSPLDLYLLLCLLFVPMQASLLLFEWLSCSGSLGPLVFLLCSFMSLFLWHLSPAVLSGFVVSPNIFLHFSFCLVLTTLS